MVACSSESLVTEMPAALDAANRSAITHRGLMSLGGAEANLNLIEVDGEIHTDVRPMPFSHQLRWNDSPTESAAPIAS